MKFTLKAQGKKLSTFIRIYYPSALSRNIIINGKVIDYNKWDQDINQYGELKGTTCGENRYIGVKNIFEFYLTSGCTLQIVPRDAVSGMVRMEWTLKNFYADGGTTKFADRLSSLLGIHSSTVKVVSVYQGSLIINWEIIKDLDPFRVSKDFDSIKSSIKDTFASGLANLGAPILDVVQESSNIITDGRVSLPGYVPIVITNPGSTTTTTTTANGGTASSSNFIPSS
jgi:hypothetical protein